MKVNQDSEPRERKKEAKVKNKNCIKSFVFQRNMGSNIKYISK